MMTVGVLVVLVVGLIREGAILEHRRPRSPAIARIGMLRPAMANELRQQQQQPQQQDGTGESAPASYLDWGAQLAVDEASRPWRRLDVEVGPIDRPLVTFMVTANVVPTIPSTCIIGMTLNSLPQGSVKLVFLDKYGVTKHGNTTPEAYDEFQRRIETREDVQLVARVPDDAPGSKLQRVLRYGLQFVKTPFVVAVQHDMPFKYPGTINFTAMAIDMARFPELKYVLCVSTQTPNTTRVLDKTSTCALTLTNVLDMHCGSLYKRSFCWVANCDSI